MDVYKKLKKQNGEKFAQTIRNHHNGILEIPNVVNILKHAGTTVEHAQACLPYLTNLLLELTSQPAEHTKPADPFELLERAGYKAFYVTSLKEQNSIKKYFTKGEELCTFNDKSRWRNYHIIHAIHKDADKLRREDFVGKEKRQDRYGTSVISIQIARKGGFISIKNRYNHTVPNCDNTFGSNPDNIISGLSAALQKHFNVSFKADTALEDGFILVDGRIVRQVMEINGVVFGERCFVKDGRLIEMGEHEYLFDHFVFNSKTKTFEDVAGTADCFPEVFNRHYGGKPSVYVKNHCIYDGDVMLVGV